MMFMSYVKPIVNIDFKKKNENLFIIANLTAEAHKLKNAQGLPSAFKK